MTGPQTTTTNRSRVIAFLAWEECALDGGRAEKADEEGKTIFWGIHIIEKMISSILLRSVCRSRVFKEQEPANAHASAMRACVQ